MNQTVRPPKVPKKPPRKPRDHTAFLPAALEILETPASPIRAALIWFISVFVILAIVWSYFGRFDIVATAQGKLQPTGRVKVIQSLGTGKTAAIPVTNGSKVKAGDIVVELDPTETRAEVNALLASLRSLRAEVIRRTTARAQVETWQRAGLWTNSPTISMPLVFGEDIPPSIRTREEAQFQSSLEQLASSLANLSSQREQQLASLGRFNRMVAAQKNLIATMDDRVTMRSQLMESSAGPRAGVIDAMEAKQRVEADLAEQIGQADEAAAALAVASTEGEKAIKAFIAENVEKQTEAERQIDEQEQQLIRAEKKLDAMTIKSPINGTVQTSAITTVGQVVMAGSELMRVVPENAALEIEAYLPNQDIGFVAPGQLAVIKVQAFPFTRYGVIEGKVTRVATDAIPEPDAQQLEGQPDKQLQSSMPIGNAQRVQNLVFPITVVPDVGAINVDGTSVALSPGMAVSVEIKTGSRRILEYLFSPMAEVSSEAMKER